MSVVCTLVLGVLAPPTQAEVRYIHTDALGSVVAVTDEQGNVIERREYEPYGAQLTPAMKDGPGYTGHVQDAATGLVYMQQRYYDPGIGRFLSVEPVTTNSAAGANFNRYWYANNNPYKFTDPDGRMIRGIGDPPWGGGMFGCNGSLCDNYRDMPGWQSGGNDKKEKPESCDETCEIQQLRGQQIKIVGDAAEAMSKVGDIVEMAAPIPGLPALKAGRFTASGLARLAEKAGWKRTQSATGPIIYRDAKGVKRLTLKQGSPRTPGSEGPHAEFRDATGQRVNALGNNVTRRSAENHSEIVWDIE